MVVVLPLIVCGLAAEVGNGGERKRGSGSGVDERREKGCGGKCEMEILFYF